jgi:hypothetical protein
MSALWLCTSFCNGTSEERTEENLESRSLQCRSLCCSNRDQRPCVMCLLIMRYKLAHLTEEIPVVPVYPVGGVRTSFCHSKLIQILQANSNYRLTISYHFLAKSESQPTKTSGPMEVRWQDGESRVPLFISHQLPLTDSKTGLTPP